MTDYGPICSLCSRDWDTRLDYCPHCEPTLFDEQRKAER